MEILSGRGDSVLFARYTGGDSVLVNKKEWGGFCPGGILSYTPSPRPEARHRSRRLELGLDAVDDRNIFSALSRSACSTTCCCIAF